HTTLFRSRGHGARAREEAAVAWLLLEGATVQEDLAAEQGHPRPPAGGPALVRRESGDAEVLLLLNRPRGRGIPDGQVCVGARTYHALARIEPEDARGVL